MATRPDKDLAHRLVGARVPDLHGAFAAGDGQTERHGLIGREVCAEDFAHAEIARDDHRRPVLRLHSTA